MSSTSTKWAIGCSSCFGALAVLIVLVAVLVIAFYVEEDARGAHELAVAEARWTAAGFSLKADDYIPPAVPDGQNLAALPIFKLEPDPDSNGTMTDLRLRAALDPDKHGGELSDPVRKKDLVELVAQAYAKKFPGKALPASTVTQLEQLYPLVDDLRSAAPARPEFRLNIDYNLQPAIRIPLGPMTRQITVAKLVTNHAELALRENQPQVALDDIRLDFQIARGVGKCPSLVAGLVSLGVVAIARREIDEGLKEHAWNDQQLAHLQDTLRGFDGLARFQFAMSSETAMFSLPMYVWLKTQSSNVKWVMEMSADADDDSTARLLGVRFAQVFWANGWWDMNAAQTADVLLEVVNGVDLQTRQVDPKIKQRLDESMEKTKRLPAPWNILFVTMAGPLTNAIEKFAQAQAQLDEDRIVCGLERYRLAHGAYPPKLDALVPADIDELPHDLMNGQGYHYRLNADGTFVLYSVGWNQVDDGGKVVLKSGEAKSIDFDSGDWVWPMVPSTK